MDSYKLLTVRITNRSLIKASDLSLHPCILPVSNFDLIPARNPAALIFIYPKPAVACFDSISTVIKTNLPCFLNYFFPFAGRVSIDVSTGRPEVICNNAGAEIIEARADVSICSIDFSDTEKSAEAILLPSRREIPLSIQLVGFTCGGYSLTWCSNHLLVDAYSLSKLACLWSGLVRTGSIARGPTFNRLTLHPRSPPRYNSSVDSKFVTISQDGLTKLLTKESYHRGIYYVTASDLDRLQALASQGGHKATRTEAFSAHVWKVLAEVVGESSSACQMGWLVDGRRRMGKACEGNMEGYIGNMHSFASEEASVQSIKTSLLSEVAGVVAKAIEEVANEDHFRDLIDWIECRDHSKELMFHKVQLGMNSPSIVISSCHNFSLETDFGFGQAALAIFHTPGSDTLPTGFMNLAACLKGDGSWTVDAVLWLELALALQTNSLCALRPLTAEYLTRSIRSKY